MNKTKSYDNENSSLSTFNDFGKTTQKAETRKQEM